MNLLTALIIVYVYSVALTMYVAYQEMPKPNWAYIIPGSILWPLSIAGFVLWFLYMSITVLPARWYKQWKRKRSDEYKARMKRLDEYLAKTGKEWTGTSDKLIELNTPPEP